MNISLSSPQLITDGGCCMNTSAPLPHSRICLSPVFLSFPRVSIWDKPPGVHGGNWLNTPFISWLSFPVPLLHLLPEFFSHLENKLSIFKILFLGLCPPACWLNMAPKNILTSTQPDWLLLPQHKQVKGKRRDKIVRSESLPQEAQCSARPAPSLCSFCMEMSLKLPSRELFRLCPQAWESLWFVLMKVTRLRRDRLLKSDGFGQAFCCPLHLSESTPLKAGGGGEQGDHYSRGKFSEREKRSKHAALIWSHMKPKVRTPQPRINRDSS